MDIARKEWELEQLFDELAELLDDNHTSSNPQKEVLKNFETWKNEKNDILPQVYHRKTGPKVISLEEYRRRVEKGSFKEKIDLDPKSKTEPKGEVEIQVKPELKIKPETKVKKETKIKKENGKKIKKPSIRKRIKTKVNEIKEKRKISKISKTVEKNVNHAFRFTEPKKRNMLSRIILQRRFCNAYYEDLEYDYENNLITQKEVDNSRESTKRRDRKLFKEVQEYEDAKEDVSARKGWIAFKLGLATAAIAGVMAFGSYAYSESQDILNRINSRTEIVSIYDMTQEQRSNIELQAERVKEEITEKSGYHFDNISDEEFAEGYYRILNYEKDLHEKRFESAMYGMFDNDDQKLLDSIVEGTFKEEYTSFSDEKKRDYRQLAYELIAYSHPSKQTYIRSPIVMDELATKETLLNEKGYRIQLIVNGDEKETVRNLGNIMHEIHEMEENYFKSFEDNQELFFDGLLEKVLGDKYQELGKKDKRDYKQIIYEWLPDSAKQYIKDPIELEIENAQLNDMER